MPQSADRQPFLPHKEVQELRDRAMRTMTLFSFPCLRALIQISPSRTCSRALNLRSATVPLVTFDLTAANPNNTATPQRRQQLAAHTSLAGARRSPPPPVPAWQPPPARKASAGRPEFFEPATALMARHAGGGPPAPENRMYL
jgi:hypothetical protein